MNRFEDTVVIVTGAARGMGAAHAEAFAAEGALVVLTDLLDEGRDVAERIGEKAIFVHHDVTSEEGWSELVTRAEEAFGPVGVLVNNAGVGHARLAIEDLPLAEWHRTIDIDLTGVFLGIKTVVPSMHKAGGGAIVNVSSVAGLQGYPLRGAYAAAKFGLRGLTKVAALELGDANIRVNSIHPGYIRTPLLGNLDETGPARRDLAIKRFAQPEEVSRMVLFLASAEASYSTGSEFVIDGGWTAGGPIG